MLRKLVLRVARARLGEEPTKLYHWRKGTAYTAYGLAFLMVGVIWLESFASLATIVGLVSAGLAVALKDLLMNLAGWVFILWRKPFVPGQRIALGDFRGDVVDQGAFTFSLMEIGQWVNADERTGRLLHVPNGLVFTEVLANYNQGWFDLIWNELSVTVTFESDWRSAKAIMVEIAERRGTVHSDQAQAAIRDHASQYLVFDTRVAPRVYSSVLDSGVGLTLRYLCNPFERRRTAEVIWEDVLDAFHERADIDFAYPTTRFYDNVREGKDEARAAP
nr:mechanosensitive ion channel family protein [Pseudenhygromyxa sp. WMMC2535]